MKRAPVQTTNESAPTCAFYIDNPRERSLLAVLLQRGETSRHDLDGLVGAENSPDVVFRLRNKGLSIPCERRAFVDRYGQTVRVGFYSLSAADRPKAIAALNCRG